MKFTHLLTTMCAMSLVSYGEEKQTNLFDYNISVDKKKLLPFSRLFVKCRCTGRLGTGVVAATTPVWVPFCYSTSSFL